VNSGARNVKEIKRHLKIFVEKQIYRDKPAPPRSNQRFYPSKTTIRSHIYKTLVKQRFSMCDQENLEKKVEEWRSKCPGEKFFFRPYVSEESTCPMDEEADDNQEEDDNMEDTDNENEVTLPTSKNGLLFVHQTDNQRRLLLRYGNELSMLDATYKTTKYSLALFFLVVKTNVNYQIVASFVLQNETFESIAEALKVISDWNDSWSPSFFMVDYSEEEMSAIASLFPGVHVIL
jgi:hypothetical protein